MGRLLVDISISLDGNLGTKAELETTRVIDSPGVTHLKFRVVK